MQLRNPFHLILQTIIILIISLLITTININDNNIIIIANALTLDQQKDLTYSITFSREPVPIGIDNKRYYPMRLSNGSAYICVLPEAVEEENKEEYQLKQKQQQGKNKKNTQLSFNINSPLSIESSETLHNAFRNWCFNMVEDWWTYQLCWNNRIEQYHITPEFLNNNNNPNNNNNNNNINSNSRFILGVAPQNENILHLRLGLDPTGDRYAYIKYNNGDLCDLTKKPRVTEVRVYCANVGEETKLQIREIEVCQYVASLRTRRACVGELQRQVQQKVITCYEVL